MSSLEISIDGGATHFRPTDVITGRVEWYLEEPPSSLELRLFWYTQGRGDQDSGIAATACFGAPTAMGSSSFELVLPAGPYSFSGSLISLCWALELVALPGRQTQRTEIVVAPEAAEIELSRGAA